MASRAPAHSAPCRRRRFSPHRRLTGRFWWDRPHPSFFYRRIHGNSPQPHGSPCVTGKTPKLGLGGLTQLAAISSPLDFGRAACCHACAFARRRIATFSGTAGEICLLAGTAGRSLERSRRIRQEEPDASVSSDLSPVTRAYPEVWVLDRSAPEHTGLDRSFTRACSFKELAKVSPPIDRRSSHKSR